MALAHWQKTFVDTAGNVQPGLSVTIRNESTGAIAAIFTDSAGTTVKANPFDTDSFGYGDFYAADGRYRIQATGIDWRDEEVLTFENLAAAVEDAEAARDAATLNAGIYDNTTDGLAATVDGEYFSTPAAGAEDYLTLYRNDAGVATEIDTYPNSTAIDNFLASLANSTSGNGSDLVAHTGTTETVTEALDRRVIRLNDMTSFQNVAAADLVDGYQFRNIGYMPGSDKGGMYSYYDASRSKNDHNGGTVVSPTVPWDGLKASLNDFHAGVGETDPGGTGVFVMIVENNEVDLAQFGIEGGDGIQYLLAPIINWAESNGVNITGSASASASVEFTDTFNVKQIKFGGDSPLHIKYVGTLDISEAPVIIMGESDLATYGPARFASIKQYRVGEALSFSGGAWGEVLFVMGGYVYFHAVLDGATFPANGETVNGLSSGRTDTVAEIRAQAFTPVNYNARIENVFLTTTLDLDGNGHPLSHTQATGIFANGVHAARWFGGVKNVTVQGFYNGFIAVHAWFMNFEGSLTTDRCAHGTLLAEECNQINLNNVINSVSGTPYDSVARRSFRVSHSYAVKGFVDSETQVDTSFQEITACKGINITGGDVEFYETGQAWKFGGSAALDHVVDPTTEENKKFWNRAISFRNIRAFQSLLFLAQSYNDGVNIEDIACDYNVGDPLAVVSNVISFSGATNCDNIRLRNVVSQNFNFKSAFEAAHTLSDNVKFTDDCYEVIELSDSFYIPAAKTSINLSRKVASSNTDFELLDVSFGNEFGQSPAMDAALFDFDAGNNAWNFTLSAATASPEYGTFRSSSFSGTGKYTDTDGFRVRLTNMRSDADNWYNYTVRMRRLSI